MNTGPNAAVHLRHRLATDVDSYLHPCCKGDTLDLFTIRRGVLDALRSNLRHFEGTVLDVGCGYQPYRTLLENAPARTRKYVGLDLDTGLYRSRPDITWDGKVIPLGDSSIDSAVATEVLEHCPEPGATLKEIARVLKPNGFLFLTVPFMWPLHDMPYDEYRFTPTALTRHLTVAGFEEVTIHATGGWDASLAQMVGLWVRNRPMRLWKRRILTALAGPIMRHLISLDIAPLNFDQYVMVTGFATSARKRP